MASKIKPGQDTSKDDQVILDAGYKPRLHRSLGFFSSFAVMFSSVSVLMGIFSNFGFVLAKAGPFGFWTWPIVGCGQLIVAFVFAEMAGRLPLTGAIYNWNSRMANPFVGWFTACVLFFGYCIGAVGVIVAMLTPLQTLLGKQFLPGELMILGVFIILVHMAINIYGVALASRTNKIAVISELIALVVFGSLLLAVVFIHGQAQTTLLTAKPTQPIPYWPGFLMSSLMAAWTLVGFELPADLSEETLDVRHVAPRSIVIGVVASILLGLFFIGALTLAIPDVASVTAASDPISTIISFHLGDAVMKIFLIFVLVVMFALALLVMAGAARILYAIARDGHIVGASFLTKISAHKVPHVAIMCVAVIQIIFFLSAKDAVDLYTASTVLFFAIYLITVVCFACGFKKLPQPGKFSLASWRWLTIISAILWLTAMICVLILPPEFHNAARIAGIVLLICLAAGVIIRARTKS